MIARAAAAMEAPEVQIDTSMGSFTVELYVKHAPLTVKNFCELAKKGYYDGVICELQAAESVKNELAGALHGQHHAWAKKCLRCMAEDSIIPCSGVA